MPSMLQSKRRLTAQRGTAADSPMSSTSSGTGWAEKQEKERELEGVGVIAPGSAGRDRSDVSASRTGRCPELSVVVKAIDGPDRLGPGRGHLDSDGHDDR